MSCANPYASTPCGYAPPPCGYAPPPCACPPPPCATSICCAPTGPTGPANPSAAGSFTVGYFSTTPATIPAASGFFVPFNAFTAGSSPSYLIGTGVFQAPSSGLYMVNLTVGITAAAPTVIVASLMKNGVAQLSYSAPIFVAGTSSLQLSTVLQLSGGDVFQVQCQDTGAGGATLAAAVFPGYSTSLAITPLSAS